MARLLAGMLVVGVLAFGLWLWAGSGDRGRPGDVRGPRGEALAVPRVSQPLARPGEVVTPADAVPAETSGAREESRRERLSSKRSAATKADLLVRVVDPRDRPLAGVPLVLVPGDPARHEPQASAVTDREGYVVFENVRSMVSRAVEPWVLFHDVPFLQKPTLALTSSVVESSPVVSVQPWSGRIEVVVSEPDGEPAPDTTRVELSLVGDEEAVDPTLALERPAWTGETFEGRAVFDHVELGRDWGAKATRPGSDVPSRAAGPGPSGLGDSAVIEVVLGTDHAILAYRAVDEAGTPLREAKLGLQHTKFFGMAQEREATTDAEGRFTVDMDRGWIFGQGSIVVTHETAAGEKLQGRIQLAVVEDPGKHDMGDVVLARNPLLARGRVEDVAGNPVPAAKVVADTGRFGDSPLDRAGFGWNSGTVETQSDANGRFELRGLLAADEIYLQAEKDGRRSLGTPVAEGATDVVLVVEARWRVTGRLLLDPGIEAGRLRLRLIQAQDENAKEYGVESFPGDGTFAFKPVPPGDYRFECFLETERLAAVEDLRLFADVDLGEIDLRGVIHRHEIVLVGAADPDSLRGEIGWRPAGSDRAWQDTTMQGALVELLTPESPIDVWVRPHGYRFARLEDVAGRQEVELLAPIRVRLDLVTSGVLPKFPYTFDPDLYQEGVHVGFPEGSEFFTDENRSVVFLVSAPGRTTVKWHLERKIENGAIGGQLLQDHEVTLDILDVGGEQVFRVELDGEALTRLSTKPPW